MTSAEAHRFLNDCADFAPTLAMDHLWAQRRPIPGFGHKVYRGVNPRLLPLLEQVCQLDPNCIELIEAVIAEAGRVIAQQLNIDVKIGALTRVTVLEPDTLIFAVACIAR